MASTNIQFDRSNQFGQEIKALLNAYRKVTLDGPNILAHMVHIIDGDGTQEAHFQPLVTMGVFPAAADAMAGYNELASANSKVSGDGTVDTVNTALKQACDKFGVI